MLNLNTIDFIMDRKHKLPANYALARRMPRRLLIGPAYVNSGAKINPFIEFGGILAGNYGFL